MKEGAEMFSRPPGGVAALEVVVIPLFLFGHGAGLS